MSGREWRSQPGKPVQRACGLCGTQWPTERLELVERLIGAERRASVAERALRDRMDHPEDRGVVLAQQARIQELEEIVGKLNEKRMRKGAA